MSLTMPDSSWSRGGGNGRTALNPRNSRYVAACFGDAGARLAPGLRRSFDRRLGARRGLHTLDLRRLRRFDAADLSDRRDLLNDRRANPSDSRQSGEISTFFHLMLASRA